MSAALLIARFKVSTKALDVFSLEIGSPVLERSIQGPFRVDDSRWAGRVLRTPVCSRS